MLCHNIYLPYHHLSSLICTHSQSDHTETEPTSVIIYYVNWWIYTVMDRVTLTFPVTPVSTCVYINIYADMTLDSHIRGHSLNYAAVICALNLISDTHTYSYPHCESVFVLLYHVAINFVHIHVTTIT